MVRKKNDDGRDPLHFKLLPVRGRQESELRELMKTMMERGSFPKEAGWKDFIDKALESLITLIKLSPEQTFEERNDLLRDFYNSKVMGFIPLPIHVLQTIVDKNPEIAEDIVSTYSSLFKHYFLDTGEKDVNAKLNTLKRFFLTITPMQNKQNIVVKTEGNCGAFSIFTTILSKTLLDRIYAPLLHQVLLEMGAEVKSLKGDNLVLEAKFC
ncbi:hypothetical protein GWK48_09460 [Metallosphaera tengchongensis]|uniref:Uncharacterized protein n=1 Tax=Metallosphaera tengchongensis TaxID=1532350 RepID=A0A6N0NUV8_9CREN|nr:hypothetical protein [Metallosphaera tengchongensis]QKR00576.1 hypothetical protein GWK48_09460 [Metallosphaera tengchongensis]